MAAKNRRHIWEMYGDVRAVNTFLLAFSSFCAIAVIVLSLVLLSIYRRPPYILTQDEGMVMWRTTEVFKLRADMIGQFLRTTLGVIYTSSPSDYDLSTIAAYLDPNLLNKLTGKQGETAELRLRADQRQFFNMLGFRRVVESKYPQFIAIVVRADQTIMNESRDANGNLITSSKSDIVFVVAYLAQRNPTPSNPWGLYLVGIEKGTSAQLQNVWEAAVPIENTKDQKNNIIKP